MTWARITDPEFAEFAPVTSRIMRKLRGNLYAVAEQRIYSEHFAEAANTNSASEVDLISIRLYVAPRVIGPAGITIEVNVSAYIVEGATPPDALGTFRLQVGTDYGVAETVFVPAGSFAGFLTIDLDETTTTGYYTVKIVGNSNDTSHTLYVTALQRLRLIPRIAA